MWNSLCCFFKAYQSVLCISQNDRFLVVGGVNPPPNFCLFYHDTVCTLEGDEVSFIQPQVLHSYHGTVSCFGSRIPRKRKEHSSTVLLFKWLSPLPPTCPCICISLPWRMLTSVCRYMTFPKTSCTIYVHCIGKDAMNFCQLVLKLSLSLY